ncbi:glycosyltransferase family 2 protein [Sulfitobacter sp. R86518]|uniref:glycosyltransferase family 2 protein n=1 Tax=Sulfitobacter sp. R86518 TaxID=3093858 RepID=UPI0036D7EF0A
MPLFNSSKFMESAISSVIQQDYSNWELIVVDDCSTDKSAEIAEQVSKNDSRIKVVRLSKNGGSAVARNAGINKANGKYISFLDADDIWLPNKLSSQVLYMRENEVTFCFSDYRVINEDSEVIGERKFKGKVDYETLLLGNIIGCLTAIYDREELGTIFMPDIRMRQDYGLWLKILKETSYAHNCQMVLAEYRQYDSSLSANKIRAASYTWILYRDFEKISLLKRIYIFSRYAVSGISQKIKEV